MRPVCQAETALGRGDCLRACVASLLELGADEVPNFRLADDQWGAMQDWLAGRGLTAIRVRPDGLYPRLNAHCIVTGDSPRNSTVLHAVVGKIEDDTIHVVHDPHPENTGLNGPPQWLTFLGNA